MHLVFVYSFQKYYLRHKFSFIQNSVITSRLLFELTHVSLSFNLDLGCTETIQKSQDLQLYIELLKQLPTGLGFFHSRTVVYCVYYVNTNL